MRVRLVGMATVLAVIAVGTLIYFSTISQVGTAISLSRTTEGADGRAVAGSVSGLQLHLSVNATSLTPGKAVLIDVYEFNPSNGIVNASAKMNWASRALGVGVPPCQFENEPISIS